MKSAEEILRVISSVCRKFPDPTCGYGGACICNADLAAIRAAQIDAAEWMREEAAKTIGGGYWSATTGAAAIRSIKLPGETK